ncbi:MAG: DUF1259 domain-containing protein [Deltaproteobacteria bacterium]|nr:DUF1259 domain-containing protein [Deltaproteobacteria bacterium]
MKIAAVLFFILASFPSLSLAALNIAGIENITGLKGRYIEKEEVYRITIPHEELKVSALGISLTPPQGLTSWAGFKKPRDKAILSGDIVLLEDQVNPVMSVALDSGLSVTALHNHFLRESPRVMFMHISGLGDEAVLANGLKRVLDKMKESLPAPPAPRRPRIGAGPLTQGVIEDALGEKVEQSNGALKATLGRQTLLYGEVLGSSMGINSWAAFAGSDKEAVVNGDFVVFENELQEVLKALRASNIEITAIHNHLVMEVPRLVFIHYWGTGTSAGLAKGVRAALEAQVKAREEPPKHAAKDGR